MGRDPVGWDLVGRDSAGIRLVVGLSEEWYLYIFLPKAAYKVIKVRTALFRLRPILGQDGENDFDEIDDITYYFLITYCN